MSGAALARAARELLGVPFLLHGRDPATGLDCIGVLCAAMSAIGRPAALPQGYKLRSTDTGRLDDWAEQCGFVSAGPATRPGDVQMVRCAPCQLHLVIAVEEQRFVHAHARLKRVVLASGPLSWPLVGQWRLRDDS